LQDAGMLPSQRVGLALLVLLPGGLVHAFMRQSPKVKPDRAHDSAGVGDWSEYGGHGSDSSGH
jgi:hypothetical protein